MMVLMDVVICTNYGHFLIAPFSSVIIIQSITNMTKSLVITFPSHKVESNYHWCRLYRIQRCQRKRDNCIQKPHSADEDSKQNCKRGWELMPSTILLRAPHPCQSSTTLACSHDPQAFQGPSSTCSSVSIETNFALCSIWQNASASFQVILALLEKRRHPIPTKVPSTQGIGQGPSSDASWNAREGHRTVPSSAVNKSMTVRLIEC